MLFDEFKRNYTGPAQATESSYDFLNRSARPDWEQLRSTLEAWFADYPSVEAKDLRARFRSRIPGSHFAAWWELYLFTLFRTIGFSVDVHPAVMTGDRRPDST